MSKFDAPSGGSKFEAVSKAAADIIEIEVLENGTARITTPAISDVNHAVADELVAELKKMLGGPVEVVRRPRSEVQHRHGHGHHHHNH